MSHINPRPCRAGIGKSQLCHMLSILALLPSVTRHSSEVRHRHVQAVIAAARG